jgi:hypothetical protein
MRGRGGADDDDDDRDRGRGRDSGRDDDDGERAPGNTRPYVFQSTLDRINEQFELPDDFHRSDANGDGQIAMSEYASEWPQSKIQEFVRLDKNGDGIITAAEYAAGLESGFKPGSSASSRSGSVAGSSSSATQATSSSGYTESRGSTSTTSASTSAADKYLEYAKGVIAKYDANKSGALEQDEAGQVSFIKPGADADGDGKITAEELATSLSKR